MFRIDPRGPGTLGTAVVLVAAAAFSTAHCASKSASEPVATKGAAHVARAGTRQSSRDAERFAGGAEPMRDHALSLIEEGEKAFRYETFGDEDYWGGTLRLHEAIAGEAHDGVGEGVGLDTALGLGLKIDADALPPAVSRAIRAGAIDRSDPGATLDMLKADAVLGVKGFFDAKGKLVSIGVQCALCHSTVDDSLAPGIGRRLDAWANRDLDIGAIMNLSPDLSSLATLLETSETEVRDVLKSWGAGKFDASLVLDGRGTRYDGKPSATLIPPAFGLAGVSLQTSTGSGSGSHFTALVAVLVMHGKGTFYDPRLRDTAQFPVASRAGLDNVRSAADLVSPKLAALQLYQLAIDAPKPPLGSWDVDAAERGKKLFDGQAKCATCHVPPLFTEPGWNMHSASEIGIDDIQAMRAPDQRYRTSPLRGLFAHAKGGFYHDGRFATLADVVAHYDSALGLDLTAAQQSDVVEYLKSL